MNNLEPFQTNKNNYSMNQRTIEYLFSSIFPAFNYLIQVPSSNEKIYFI